MIQDPTAFVHVHAETIRLCAQHDDYQRLVRLGTETGGYRCAEAFGAYRRALQDEHGVNLAALLETVVARKGGGSVAAHTDAAVVAGEPRAEAFVAKHQERIRELAEGGDYIGLMDLGERRGGFQSERALAAYRSALEDVDVDLEAIRKRWLARQTERMADEQDLGLEPGWDFAPEDVARRTPGEFVRGTAKHIRGLESFGDFWGLVRHGTETGGYRSADAFEAYRVALIGELGIDMDAIRPGAVARDTAAVKLFQGLAFIQDGSE